MPSSPSADWPLQGVEENGGIDSLPFRLMLQDCTAVKTLLLKMKRVLQESADMSPASSTTSLPVSPLTEEPLPFKTVCLKCLRRELVKELGIVSSLKYVLINHCLLGKHQNFMNNYFYIMVHPGF
nr:PREDICTED: serine-rich coiled-coil domain-containing protein 1-like [Equus przewalskii]